MIAGRQLLAVTAGIAAFGSAAAGLAWIWTSRLALPFSPFAETLTALGLPPFATFASVTLVGMRWCGLGWRDLGFRPVAFDAILSGIGTWLLCIPVVAGLIFLMSQLTGSTAIGRQVALLPALRADEGWQILPLAVLIVFAAPLAEEILFRGLLFGWIRRHLPFWPSALASALVFSLLHMIVEVIPPTTVLGLAFAWMYERSGSLWTPVAVHMLHNGIVFGVTYVALAQGIPLGGG